MRSDVDDLSTTLVLSFMSKSLADALSELALDLKHSGTITAGFSSVRIVPGELSRTRVHLIIFSLTSTFKRPRNKERWANEVCEMTVNTPATALTAEKESEEFRSLGKEIELALQRSSHILLS